MGRVAVDAWCVHAVVDTLLFAPAMRSFTTIVMVVVMVQLDAGLTLLALAVAPFMTAAAWLFGRPIREAAHARREIESRIQAHVHQTLTGVSVVQAFAREDDEQRRFQDLASVAIRAHQRSRLVGSVYGLGSGLLTTIGTAAVMWAAAMRVLDGRLTVGTRWCSSPISHRCSGSSRPSPPCTPRCRRRRQHRSRHGGASRTTTACPSGASARPLPPCAATCRIENVDFGYVPDQPVLRGVSIAARGRRRRRHRRRRRAPERAPSWACSRVSSIPIGRSRADRRPRRARRLAGEPARSGRGRAPGAVPLPDLASPRTSRSAGPTPRGPRSRRRPAAPTPTTSSRPAARLRHGDRRAGRDAVGRRAPADRHRPRPAQGRTDPDPRRADQRARRGDRAGHRRTPSSG